MGFNIIDAMAAKMTPDVVNRIAESTGENPGRVRASVSVAIHAFATGLVQRGSTRAGAESILSTLRAPRTANGGVTSSLLGVSAATLTDGVANASGVNRATAASVMS